VSNRYRKNGTKNPFNCHNSVIPGQIALIFIRL